MPLAFVSVVILAAVALAVPAAMLLLSKLLGREDASELERKSFEWGEETVGVRNVMMDGRLHYVFVFLALEVISVIIAAWAVSARSVPFYTSVFVLLMPVCGLALAMLALRMGGSGG